MLSIKTNLSNLIIQNSLSNSTNKLNEAIERMSTGYKINHAKDNAANYSISTNMTTKIGALQIAEDNVLQGLDMINTASESLSLIEDKLMRLRTLATQTSNGTYGTQSKQAINAEANALVDEIERLYSTTEYNGIKLFDQEVQIPDYPNIPKAQYDGFIKEVVKRDTSTMTTLASVDPNTALADGTYSISTPEEMKKLADMTNAGLVSAGDEFVLANDIDLSQYENWTPIGKFASVAFRGIFDGNGYSIKNLSINEANGKVSSLFAQTDSTTISNLALENCNISVNSGQAAGLIGQAIETTIDNCYVTGTIKNSFDSSAGFCVNAQDSKILNSYTDAILLGKCSVSGIITFSAYKVEVQNCFTNSKILGLEDSAGISACNYKDAVIEIINCAVLGDSPLKTVFVHDPRPHNANITIKNSAYSSFYAENNIQLQNNDSTPIIENLSILNQNRQEVFIQSSINLDSKNQISCDTSYVLNEISLFRLLGLTDVNLQRCTYFERIERVLKTISTKQTEYGAVQNRLESALEEIATQYDNLVSSRSTLRDADIAEVSSEYVKQQILQEAAATLLSSAQNIQYQNVLGLLNSLR